MATAAEKIAPFDYTLESDAEAQKKTVFNLRPLNGFEYITAGEILVRHSKGEGFEYVLKTALLGWSQFLDHDGKEIEFTRNQKENLNRLTHDQVRELGNKVLEASIIDETERKN